MNRYPAIPRTARIDGRDWSIERVWPERKGEPRMPLEARSGRAVRGGYADEEGIVTLLDPGEDPALPALGAVIRHGELVSHRPGKRAVVRLGGGHGYAKVVPTGRAQRVREGHGRGRGFAVGFRLPEIVGHGFPVSDVVCFTGLRGTTLAEHGSDPGTTDGDWAATWEAWEQGWLATMAAASADSLPEHGVSEEEGVIHEWAGRAAAQLGDGGRIEATAERIISRLSAAGAASALAHRDLHDGQLLWHPRDGLGMIDLDTCVRADPGLDLGNLAAHADFAVRQGRWSTARAAGAVISIVRTAAALGVDAERLAAWRLAARFRVACVHVLRPRWRAAAHAELRSITEMLSHDA